MCEPSSGYMEHNVISMVDWHVEVCMHRANVDIMSCDTICAKWGMLSQVDI